MLQEGLERGNADNPPHGAILHYFLKTKPKGDVTLEVFDDKENFVRKLNSKAEEKEPAEQGDYYEAKDDKPLPAEAGLQRVVWDLHYTGAKIIKKAAEGSSAKEGPLVLPGMYTVKLTVDGKSVTTQLEVKQDPRVKLPTEELAKQLDVILAMRDEVTRLTGVVEQIRSVRRQIKEQSDLLKDHAKGVDLVSSGKKVIARAGRLGGKTAQSTCQDQLRHPGPERRRQNLFAADLDLRTAQG